MSTALQGQQHMLIHSTRGSGVLRRWVEEIGRHKHRVTHWLVRELSLRHVPGVIGLISTLEAHLEKLLQRALHDTRMLNNSTSVVACFSEVWVPAGREVDFLEAYRRLWPAPGMCKMIFRDPADYMEQARAKVAAAYPGNILAAQRWAASPTSVTLNFEDEPACKGSKKIGHLSAKRHRETGAAWRANAEP